MYVLCFVYVPKTLRGHDRSEHCDTPRSQCWKSAATQDSAIRIDHMTWQRVCDHSAGREPKRHTRMRVMFLVKLLQYTQRHQLLSHAYALAQAPANLTQPLWPRGPAVR